MTVDELKELNLMTNEEPCPIYVSTMLMPKEEDECFKILSEYKDVFGWSYKEVLPLHPEVMIHNLPLKRAVHLKNSFNGIFILSQYHRLKKRRTN